MLFYPVVLLSNGGKVKNRYSSIFETEKRHNVHKPEYICFIAILVVKFSIGGIQNYIDFAQNVSMLKSNFFEMEW